MATQIRTGGGAAVAGERRSYAANMHNSLPATAAVPPPSSSLSVPRRPSLSPPSFTNASSSTPTLRSQAIELSICILGIYVCYIYYAVLQEKLTTQPQSDGRKFSSPLFLMLVQCGMNAALVWPLLWWKEGRRSTGAPPAAKVAEGCSSMEEGKAGQNKAVGYRPPTAPSTPAVCQMRSHHYALLALSYLLGMVSSYAALDYISFPTQVLLKSCKMMPVMFIGAVVFKQRYSLLEYLAVGLISLGIWAFFAFKDGASAAGGGSVETASTGLGILLSLFSLLCDGITGSGQDHYVAKYHPSSERLMYSMNQWAVIELLVGCFLLTSQGVEGIDFLTAHPSVLFDLLVFGLVSALGQLFIFRTVIQFGALPLSIATSTRKFFTILSSVIYFGHKLQLVQWAAVAAVFMGLFIDIGKKAWNKKKKARNNQKKENKGE